MNSRHRNSGGVMSGRRHMSETLRIPQLVTAVILWMPLVEVAVVAYSVFHDDDPGDKDFMVNSGTIIYRAVRIGGRNNTA